MNPPTVCNKLAKIYRKCLISTGHAVLFYIFLSVLSTFQQIQ